MCAQESVLKLCMSVESGTDVMGTGFLTAAKSNAQWYIGSIELYRVVRVARSSLLRCEETKSAEVEKR